MKANKVLLNGVLFSVFSLVNRAFSFFLLLILANYIVPIEYGYLSLFNTVVMLVGYFVAMSTEGYLSVAFFREGNDGVKNTFSSIFYTSLIVCSFSILLLLLFGPTLSVYLNLPIDILYWAIVICFFTVFANVNLDLFRLQERVFTYGIFSCSNALLNFVLSILLVQFFLLGWKGRVYAQLVCYIFYGVVGLVIFIRGGYLTRPDFSYWKNILLWGIPLIPHLATNFIRQGCDRYIINYYHTIEDVGLFSFALNLANIIIMVGMGFNQSNSVDIYKTLGDNNMPAVVKLKRLTKQRQTICIVCLVLAFLICLACYFVIPVLLPKYGPAMNYFVILAVYGFGQCLYFLYTNYLFFYKKTKTIMSITFVSALIHLGISLCYTKYSLYYTAWTYVITQVIVVLCIRYSAFKTIKKNINC